MPSLKKIIIFTICFLAVLGLFSQLHKDYVFADKAQSQTEFETKVDNTTFSKEDADKATVENIVHSLNIAILGPTSSSLEAAEPVGAVGAFGNLIAGMINNPPVRTSEYLADLGANLGLPIKPAYAQAQGVGWRALAPVLPVWRAFRNIAYLCFVIIFIVIGFMIMFRAKINPQTVISVQAALPKIILTLLLITFSYAIAGLMIDLIYILIYLIVGVFYLFGLLTETGSALDFIFTKNPFNFVFDQEGYNMFIHSPADAVQDLISGFSGVFLSTGFVAELVGGLARLILGIAILIKLFTLFFTLIMSYLGIVLQVILAPFNLLFNALPGSSSFASWLKNLFSNIIVFPVVAGMFLLGAIILGPRGSAECGTYYNRWCVSPEVGYLPTREEMESEGGEVWVPPMLALHLRGATDGGPSANAFQGLIAFGIIMLTPTVASQVKKMLKVEPTGFGGAIMGGLLAAPSAIGGVTQQAWQVGTQIGSMKTGKAARDYYKSFPDKKPGQPQGA